MPSQVSADKFNSLDIDRFEPDDDGAVCVDWSSYATAYDLLSEHNPAYQALLHDFERFLSTIKSPEVIYDIGGGTGNYTKIAARAWPCSEIRFIEPNAGMISLARAKLPTHGSITYETLALEDIDAQGTADLVICVHALYAMPAPEQRQGGAAAGVTVAAGFGVIPGSGGVGSRCVARSASGCRRGPSARQA